MDDKGARVGELNDALKQEWVEKVWWMDDKGMGMDELNDAGKKEEWKYWW